VAKSTGRLDHDELVALVEVLWARPVHERRMVAVKLLALNAGRLGYDDAALLERLVRQSRTWALVDALATSVMARVVDDDKRFGTVPDRWATDGDFWVRRSALLALLVPLRRGAGDFERFARYADAMLDDREFFVRKAIGGSCGTRRRGAPTWSTGGCCPAPRRASGVTLREAVKPLSDEQRTSVMTASGRAPVRRAAGSRAGRARGSRA
jgi:hypothetical protein